jgi:hypothetical protein
MLLLITKLIDAFLVVKKMLVIKKHLYKAIYFLIL